MQGHSKSSVHDFLKYRLALCTGNILWLMPTCGRSSLKDLIRRRKHRENALPDPVSHLGKHRSWTLRFKKCISSCGWTEPLQTSGGLETRSAEERWCLALNVLSQRSAQLRQSPETMAHKDIHIVCFKIVLFTYRESEKEKKLQWNLNNPWSWKQTLWIVKDFDAFIEDRLLFKFICMMSVKLLICCEC